MTVTELKQTLLEWEIPENLYSIMVGGLPNERLCLMKNSEEIWEIYYSERGRKSGLKLFESEEEACEYFLKKMSRYKQ
ncbi:hypothetical protein BVE84_09380 [Streptococcus azizii]|uniref:DUF5659 domain-containing protein n=1 Tax=Streptococcus azizii TaxID=1579424 RepID=A0AB36JMM2_9STRE|nr:MULTISPECIES: hypothetical protein [Streptococcus]MBF0776804.1 hypothetical protein [Streptococcus sp. 19428wD3_AN2]ONK25983.1 hypothetical protein BVE86_08555 [Streptococcus azizii]ONK26129.1 hypothetical protein BVE85_09105 [Streptococcus azizii]ONK26380.1 hypothetical protein BVE84_09380 [Streptococcus azizii]TFU82319.1 hypothetical protein E4T83_08625 [Streptococcus sp. AN2]